MSETVIQIEDLSKQYRLGTIGTGTLVHDINRWWHKILGKEDPYLLVGEENDRTIKGTTDYVWSLRDINFKIDQGDVVGIIGRNGAGKSTLLKILSRTTSPTTGNVKIKGRVASLLEVGTGFHPELTGRENIFLNGAILGMTKKEIRRKFDEIVDFSGVERYIDTPVKRYSSGMYVRLAFAVAANLESEILIVDEVLAVGDVDFQKKCLGKMGEVSRGEGRTVLFVSHNMGSILTLCKKGLLLDNGKVEMNGNISDVVHHYFYLGVDRKEKPPLHKYRNYDISSAPVFIENVFVEGFEHETPQLNLLDEIRIVIRIVVKKAISGASIAIGFNNSEGVRTDMAFSWDDEFYLTSDPGTYNIIFSIPSPSLSPDRYTIGIGVNQGYQTVAWDGINYYPIFEIENRSVVKHWDFRPWAAHHLIHNTWRLQKID